MRKFSVLTAVLSFALNFGWLASSARAAEGKVECPNFSGEFSCGAVCDYTQDGQPTPKGCIETGLFGADREYNEKTGIESYVFRIRQTVDEKGATSLEFQHPSFEKIVVGQKLPWGRESVLPICLHKKSLFLQHVTNDIVFTGQQWMPTNVLFSQNFTMSKQGNLILTVDTARQSWNKPGLERSSKRIVCRRQALVSVGK